MSSAAIAVLVAAMSLTTTLTVGRAAAAQQQVEARLDAAGSRELVIVDAKDQGFITDSVVSSVSGLSTVERAIALGAPVDMTNAAVGRGGQRVSARTLVGQLQWAVDLTGGRWPDPGEAVVTEAAQEALGLSAPAGALIDTIGNEIPVVGTVEPRAPFTDDLTGIVAIPAQPQASQTLVVVADTARTAIPTQNAVLGLLARDDPSDLLVTSPATLADVQEEIAGDLTRYGRGLMLAVMAAGAVLIAVVVLAETLARRADLGRRRALGASRPVLIGLVVARTTIAALTGAAVGTIASIATAKIAGNPVGTSFVLATAVLSTLSAAIAAMPPAIRAALQDPVRVLRTP